jgi:hypothetical protein
MKLTSRILLMTLAAWATGCAQFEEYADENLIASRNTYITKMAWKCRKDAYGNDCNIQHIRDGFHAGYLDILSGGAGCVPALPPSRYWGPCFQNPAGRAKIEAWYRGFSDGVAAARDDNANLYSEIPVRFQPDQELPPIRINTSTPPRKKGVKAAPADPSIPLTPGDKGWNNVSTPDKLPVPPVIPADERIPASSTSGPESVLIDPRAKKPADAKAPQPEAPKPAAPKVQPKKVDAEVKKARAQAPAPAKTDRVAAKPTLTPPVATERLETIDPAPAPGAAFPKAWNRTQPIGERAASAAVDAAPAPPALAPIVELEDAGSLEPAGRSLRANRAGVR